MAFLAPLAAGASAAAPALAATTAATTGATAALGTGLSAGTILGTGAASSGILGGLGLNALGGMTSILPAAASAAAGAPALVAPALASQGLVAAATPGIFSTATPALAGLKSLATPGLLQTAGMSPLGGMASILPAGTTVPITGGLPSLAQAASPLTTAGTTGALEASKSAIIQNAMTKQAIQNAIAQNVAGGQAAQHLAASQLAGTAPSLTPSQLYTGGTQSLANVKTVASPSEAAAAQNYYDVVGRQAQIASDAARSQKMAVEAGLASPIEPGKNFMTNAMNLFQNPSVDAAIDYAKEHPYATAAGAYGLANLMQPKYNPPAVDRGRIRPYEYSIEQRPEAYAAAAGDSSEQRYFDTRMKELPSSAAKEGGIMSLAVGGPVEQMAQSNALGTNTGYPMSQINSPFYSNPTVQRPEAVNSMLSTGDTPVGAYTGEKRFAMGGRANPFGKFSPASASSSQQTSGGYNYSYDPGTNQFTQIVAPQPTQKNMTLNAMGPFGQLLNNAATGVAFSPYNFGLTLTTPTTPITPEISGGIVGVSNVPQQTYTPPPYRETTLSDLGPRPPYQSPEQRLGLTDFYSMMDERLKQQASNLPISYARGGGIASLRGQSDLGDYSDGGRLLKGPGDGVSDSIPAVIGNRQPARLANNEFVIPARIVSEIGNGSTDAGAKKLYAMMDRVQKRRAKTIGKDKVAVDSKAHKEVNRL